MSDGEAWPEDLFRVLKDEGITQVALVPDAGHARLIRMCLADNTIRVVTLTTEEEGVAMLSGAWMGGAKGVLLMQSSGVGNCINMLSLPAMHRTPLPMLVTMRGDWGEFNPAQVPMGQATQDRAGGDGRGGAARGPGGGRRADRGRRRYGWPSTRSGPPRH